MYDTGCVSSYVGDTYDNTDNTMHNHLRIKRRKTEDDCGSILTVIQLLSWSLPEQWKNTETNAISHTVHGIALLQPGVQVSMQCKESVVGPLTCHSHA
jgi:hypothetical protein